jgi:hypothetical protein
LYYNCYCNKVIPFYYERDWIDETAAEQMIGPMEWFDLYFTKTMRVISWINKYLVEQNQRSILDNNILAFIWLNLLAQYHHSSVKL